MSSSRVPGKALLQLGGRALIDRTVDRARLAGRVGNVSVATSADSTDDSLAEHCEARGISCHRGSLDDVAGRLLEAAEAAGMEAFVRVNGDSPLLDPAIVDRGIELFERDLPDLVTNVYPSRTFPAGQSVEVASTAALRRACSSMTEADEREHVTPYFYAHPEEFAISSFTHEPPLNDVRFTLDTREDAERLGRLIAAQDAERRDYSLTDLIALESCL